MGGQLFGGAHSPRNCEQVKTESLIVSESTRFRVAAEDQPNKQLPRLLPVMASSEAHLSLARRVDLFQLFCNIANEEDRTLKKLVCSWKDHNGMKNFEIISFRQKMMAYLVHLKEKLEPLNRRLKSQVDASSSAQALDICLLDFLMKHTSAPDRDLVRDLVIGMPLTGEVSASESLKKQIGTTRVELVDILKNVESTNKKIIKNLLKQSPEDQKLCYDMTMKEIEEGKVSTHRELNESEILGSILTPRFIVHQNKPRIIDNLKVSRVNETASCKDTYIPDTLDKLACHVREVRQDLNEKNLPLEKILAFSFDFQSAYKHISIEQKSDCVTQIVFLEPNSKKLLTAKLLCQPFGSSLSPRNWGRVAEMFKFLAKALFNVTIFCFVDDGFGAEPASTADSAFKAVDTLAKLLGFKLHPDKKVPPAESITLLGAIIEIAGSKINLRNPEERIRKLKTEIARILVKKSISPAQAASLRGKLGFSQTLFFGRLGRGHTHSLIRRQYSSERICKLNPDLIEDLQWWFKNLEILPSRSISLIRTPNNLVYSDASGEGGICIGTILIPSYQRSDTYIAHSGCAPTWLESANIFTLEIFAACRAVDQLSYIAPQGPTLIFIDNTAAASALIRGTTDDVTARVLIKAFWKICALARFTPWIEIVASKNNPADEPSRGRSHENLKLEYPPLQTRKCFDDKHALATFAYSPLSTTA